MWPNARISVMGGEQAANVLTQITRDARAKKGQEWTQDQEDAFKKPLLAQYEKEGHPLYSTARLWDDGIIMPHETRKYLAMGLEIATSKKEKQFDTKFGVFRM